jgi:uncharacterized protein HemX
VARGAKIPIISGIHPEIAMADADIKSTRFKTSSASKRAKGSKTPDTRVRSGLLTGGLALIFAAIALIGTGYLWYTLLLERAELLTTDVVGDLGKLKDETTALRESQTEMGGVLDEVKANQDSVHAALDKIQNVLSRHRTEWVLAETEQLLVIANNRLQLARDARSALAALRAADAQLNQISNPALLPVRRELAREIAALDAIDKIDVGGISLKLGSLAELADRLPLAPEVSRRAHALLEAKATTAASDTPTGWRALARSLWQDMRSLVRVRTDLSTQRPLLPPEQEYFLHENLKLMLYGAQLALLQGNTAVFQQNLKVAQQLLKDYYDANTQVVAAMQSELEKMRASKLVAELPDISRSLAALRAVSGARSTP